MKRFLLLSLFFAILRISTVYADLAVFNSSEDTFMDLTIIDYNGIQMVPVRETLESLGAKIAWDEYNKTVHISKADYLISVKIDADYAVINGEIVNMSAPCTIEKNSAYISLDFIFDTFKPVVSGDMDTGMKIWDSDIFIKNHGWTQLSSGLVAHAAGGYNGLTYTNSLEALLYSYERGHRVFEIDFSTTTDGMLFAVHSWQPFGEQKSSDELRRTKTFDLYNTLTLEDVLNFMLEHEDAFLVTDTKYEDKERQYKAIVDIAGKMNESLLKRIVPHAYNQYNYEAIMQMHYFDSVIYTLYESPDSDEDVLEFVSKHDNIKVVSMSLWRDSPAEFYCALNKLSKHVYLFTINNMDDIDLFKEMGIYGFYTDFIYPEDLHRRAA